MFNLLDSFSAGISLLFLVMFELLVVGWIYGKNNGAEHISLFTCLDINTTDQTNFLVIIIAARRQEAN